MKVLSVIQEVRLNSTVSE